MAYQETKDPRVKLLGDTYHARFSCKGQRVQQSLNTKNFKVAIQLVDDIEKAILLGEDWRREKELFEDLWSTFLEAKAQGKQRGKKIRKVGEKTLKEYINFGERYYLPFFGSMRVDKIDGGTWDEYMKYVVSKSRSGTGTKFLNHWKYLSGFMNWCEVMGHIKKMPDIYNPDEEGEDEDGPGRNLSDEQLKLLRLGGLNPETGEEIPAPEMPMKLWIYFGQFTGMRSFEISQLLKTRIDLQAGVIRLGRAAKGARPRSVPIHPEVLPLLLEQMNKHPNSPYLFPNAVDENRPMDRTGFKKPWTKLRQALGIECVFKDFRSSYATRAFANPALNPVVVCMALGMSMRVAMKHYIKLDEKQLNAITGAFQL